MLIQDIEVENIPVNLHSLKSYHANKISWPSLKGHKGHRMDNMTCLRYSCEKHPHTRPKGSKHSLKSCDLPLWCHSLLPHPSECSPGDCYVTWVCLRHWEWMRIQNKLYFDIKQISCYLDTIKLEPPVCVWRDLSLLWDSVDLSWLYAQLLIISMCIILYLFDPMRLQ